jgi:hypothetical protein
MLFIHSESYDFKIHRNMYPPLLITNLTTTLLIKTVEMKATTNPMYTSGGAVYSSSNTYIQKLLSKTMNIY